MCNKARSYVHHIPMVVKRKGKLPEDMDIEVCANHHVAAQMGVAMVKAMFSDAEDIQVKGLICSPSMQQ